MAAPSSTPRWQQRSRPGCSLAAGAARPRRAVAAAARGGGSSIEVNLQRLASDAGWLPPRACGPVEIRQLPGRGRGLVATADVAPGQLLFVSEPLGAVRRGALGEQLRPTDLLAHWREQAAPLSAADRAKLSLLHRPGGPPPPAATLRDLSAAKAAAKARKAGARGFGAAAVAGPTAPDDDALAAVVATNAYADDRTDGALTVCRGEAQASTVGVWPEYSLVNHGCAPNTAAPVLVGDRLLLRAAVAVPAGSELVTSYLGPAGGLPRAARQALLRAGYGFDCSCTRCRAEAAAPAEVAATLDAMHEWVGGQPDPAALLELMADGGEAARRTVAETAAAAAELLARLDAQLEESVAEPVLRCWLRAGAFATAALAARAGEYARGERDPGAASRLAELVRVFAPASEEHLLLLSDGAVRAAEAAAAGGAPAAPEDGTELRVQQLVRVRRGYRGAAAPRRRAAAQGRTAPRLPAPARAERARPRPRAQALALRYGEPRELELLTRLAGALTEAFPHHWLGLVDLTGHMGLAQLQAAAGAATATGGGGDAPRPPPPRKCAEVCLELLAAEAVALFGAKQSGPAAPAALQAVGFRVGRQLAERYSRDKPRLGDTLEVIKFVCKDFWLAVFKKQVDNLKTNHRGIYVLQDNSFRWLLRVAPAAALPDGARGEFLAAAALPYLELPCGIIRGALTHLGINCTVEADARALPSCSFTIKITS
ncbi:trappc6b [Scenedesmus sp. PABB004]|nr:trappc6b [Scenedesmus sp. PABB004]